MYPHGYDKVPNVYVQTRRERKSVLEHQHQHAIATSVTIQGSSTTMLATQGVEPSPRFSSSGYAVPFHLPAGHLP